MPQSCCVMWQAGCSTPSSQEAAVAATCSTPSPDAASTRPRDSPGPAPAPLDQQLGRGGADDQPGRRPVALVQVLAGRRLEDHLEPQRAGGDGADRALGALRRPVDAQPPERDALEPVRGARDHEQRAVDDHRAARLPHAGRQRGHLVGRAGRSGARRRRRCRAPRRCRRAAGRRPAGAAAGRRRPGRRGGRSRTAPSRRPCPPRRPRRCRGTSAAPTSRRRRTTAGRPHWRARSAGRGRRAGRRRRAAPHPSSRPAPRRCRPPGRTPRAGGCRPSRRRPGPRARTRPTAWTARPRGRGPRRARPAATPLPSRRRSWPCPLPGRRCAGRGWRCRRPARSRRPAPHALRLGEARGRTVDETALAGADPRELAWRRRGRARRAGGGRCR